MRSLLALLAVASLGLSLAACGSGSTTQTGGSSSAREATAMTIATGAADSRKLQGDDDDDDEAGESRKTSIGDSDADFDSDAEASAKEVYFDRDDAIVSRAGHAASPTELQVLAQLVKRYYAAAAVEDGATACSLIYPILEESIPEDYGQPPGQPYMRGKTCPVVMTKFFKHTHSRFVAPLEITGARVNRRKAYVLLGSTRAPASYVILERARDRWTIDTLIGSPLP